jgi:hypothetical protein
MCAGGICQAPACAPHCNPGTTCGANSDCGSQVCGSGLCQPPICSPHCLQGAACGINADCSSLVGTSNTCRVPSCSPHCNQGAACGANSDCGSRVCTGGHCRMRSQLSDRGRLRCKRRLQISSLQQLPVQVIAVGSTNPRHTCLAVRVAGSCLASDSFLDSGTYLGDGGHIHTPLLAEAEQGPPIEIPFVAPAFCLYVALERGFRIRRK